MGRVVQLGIALVLLGVTCSTPHALAQTSLFTLEELAYRIAGSNFTVEDIAEDLGPVRYNPGKSVVAELNDPPFMSARVRQVGDGVIEIAIKLANKQTPFGEISEEPELFEMMLETSLHRPLIAKREWAFEHVTVVCNISFLPATKKRQFLAERLYYEVRRRD